MAAPQWTGGKCKSVQQAKAFFRHNDWSRRQETQHTNPHIDKTKTHLNFSYKNLSYEQRCTAYDARLQSIDMGRASTGKNARTVMQSVILYPPVGLVDDKARLKEWFMRAGEVAERRFGRNMIDMAVDFDEVHEYRDPAGKLCTSREHGHLWLVPEVDGKLNGKAFSSRAVINGFNAELQDMSIREFGCPMMDGTRKKGGKPVEQLKADSQARQIIADAEGRARKIALEASQSRQEARKAVKEARSILEAVEGLQAAYKALSEENTGMLRWMQGRKVTKGGKTVYDFFRSEQAGGDTRQILTPDEVAARMQEIRRRLGDWEDQDEGQPEEYSR